MSGNHFKLFHLLLFVIPVFSLIACEPQSPTELTRYSSSVSANEEKLAGVDKVTDIDTKPLTSKPVALDNYLVVEAGDLQYADPNVLITLNGSIEAVDDAPLVQAEWIQIDGPSAAILSPKNLSTQVLVPHSDKPVSLTFKLFGINNDNFVNSDTTHVIVQPYKEPPIARVISVSVNEETEQVDFVVRLNKPAEESVSFDYTTVDQTATAGEDYLEQIGTVTFIRGEFEKTVSVPLIDNNISEGVEVFGLSIQGQINNKPVRFEGYAVLSEDEPSPTFPTTVPLPLGPSDVPAINLFGSDGNPRLHLAWPNTNNNLQLSLIDPCGNQLSASLTRATCNEHSAIFELSEGSQNIYWPGSAAPGEYRLFLDHESGLPSEYQFRAFHDDQSEQFSGTIANGNRIEIYTFSIAGEGSTSTSSSASSQSSDEKPTESSESSSPQASSTSNSDSESSSSVTSSESSISSASSSAELDFPYLGTWRVTRYANEQCSEASQITTFQFPITFMQRDNLVFIDRGEEALVEVETGPDSATWTETITINDGLIIEDTVQLFFDKTLATGNATWLSSNQESSSCASYSALSAVCITGECQNNRNNEINIEQSAASGVWDITESDLTSDCETSPESDQYGIRFSNINGALSALENTGWDETGNYVFGDQAEDFVEFANSHASYSGGGNDGFDTDYYHVDLDFNNNLIDGIIVWGTVNNETGESCVGTSKIDGVCLSGTCKGESPTPPNGIMGLWKSADNNLEKPSFKLYLPNGSFYQTYSSTDQINSAHMVFGAFEEIGSNLTTSTFFSSNQDIALFELTHEDTSNIIDPLEYIPLDNRGIHGVWQMENNSDTTFVFTPAGEYLAFQLNEENGFNGFEYGLYSYLNSALSITTLENQDGEALFNQEPTGQNISRELQVEIAENELKIWDDESQEFILFTRLTLSPATAIGCAQENNPEDSGYIFEECIHTDWQEPAAVNLYYSGEQSHTFVHHQPNNPFGLQWQIVDTNSERGAVLEVVSTSALGEGALAILSLNHPAPAPISDGSDHIIDMSDYIGGAIEFDIRVVNASYSPFEYWISVCVYNSNCQGFFTGPSIDDNEWNRVSIPFSDILGERETFLDQVDAAFEIVPVHPEQATSVRFQLDNIHWIKAPESSSSAPSSSSAEPISSSSPGSSSEQSNSSTSNSSTSSSTSSVPSFEFPFTQEQEINDSVESANEIIMVDDPVSSEIFVGGIEGEISDENNTDDYFVFPAQAGDSFSLHYRRTGGGLYGFVSVTDTNGNTLAQLQGTDALVSNVSVIEDGNVYIRIYPNTAADKGTYQLVLATKAGGNQEIESNNTWTSATYLKLLRTEDSSDLATWEAQGTVVTNDTDYYWTYLLAGDEIRIRAEALASGTLKPALTIYSGSTETLASEANADLLDTTTLTYTVPEDGAYQFAVSAADGDGDFGFYRLNAVIRGRVETATDVEPNNSNETATVIPMLAGAEGEGIHTGRAIGDIGYAEGSDDYFVFPAQAGDSFSLHYRRTGGGLYGFVSVTDTNGNTLAQLQGTDALVSNVSVIEDGNVYIRIYPNTSADKGSYAIDISNTLNTNED